MIPLQENLVVEPIRIPVWTWLVVAVALLAVYAIAVENGALLAKNATVRRQDAMRAIRSKPGQFDLIMLDPPYKVPQADLDRLLGEIAGGGVAAAGARVVLTRASKGYMPVIPLHWRLERTLTYGDAVVLVYQTP